MSAEREVTIDERLLSRIGVREWGYPTLRMPGQIWRSEESQRVFCMVAKEGSDTMLTVESLPLKVVGVGGTQWMPDKWRAALWEYVQAWPSSGCGYGPFLAISEAERCDFLRKMGAELATADNIGCVSIADSIGELAAINYERPNPE